MTDYLARVYYAASGSSGTFAVPFPYLDKGDVKVSVNDTFITAWEWSGASTIVITTSPAAGAIVKLQRHTPNTVAEAVFHGGTLAPDDLNLQSLQALYLIQEAQDETAYWAAIIQALVLSGGGDGTDISFPGNFVLGRVYWDTNDAGGPRLRVLPHMTLPDPSLGVTDNPGGFKNSSMMYWDKYDISDTASGSRLYFNVEMHQDTDPSLINHKRSNYGMNFSVYSRVPSGTGFQYPGQVSDVTRVTKGTGYSGTPTWSTTGGGGSGAHGTCAVNGSGQIVDYEVVDRGSGYTSVPNIVISGGGGSGATALGAINGKHFFPMETGPCSFRSIIAGGNTSGKAEAIVALAGHEDATADGKLVVIQTLIEAHGADTGYDQHPEDTDGDPFNAPPSYPFVNVRNNNAGTRLAWAVSSSKPGYKFATQNGFTPTGWYHAWSMDSDALWLGVRDPGYAADGSGISTEVRPGSLLIHWGVTKLDAWGRLGLGTDAPTANLDVRTKFPGEILDRACHANDPAIAPGATVVRDRVFVTNDQGNEVEALQQAVTMTSVAHGVESSQVAVKTFIGGAQNTAFQYANGLWTGAGGDPGLGKLGCNEIKVGTVGGIGTTGKLKGTAMTTAKAAVSALVAGTDISANAKAALLLIFE